MVMTVVVDLGQVIPMIANTIVIVGGIYGFWRFAKRQWKSK